MESARAIRYLAYGVHFDMVYNRYVFYYMSIIGTFYNGYNATSEIEVSNLGCDRI